MYKRALVPLDGSPVAESVLPFLMRIAGPLGMSVVLIRVLEPITPVVGDGMQTVVVDDIEARTREAGQYLAPVAAALRARGVDSSWEVWHGRPEREIVAAAAVGADLIAMSTHGRSGLGRLLFGSVAEQVLRNADVPVFMMRETEARLAAKAIDGAHQSGVPAGRSTSAR